MWPFLAREVALACEVAVGQRRWIVADPGRGNCGKYHREGGGDPPPPSSHCTVFKHLHGSPSTRSARPELRAHMDAPVPPMPPSRHGHLDRPRRNAARPDSALRSGYRAARGRARAAPEHEPAAPSPPEGAVEARGRALPRATRHPSRGRTCGDRGATGERARRRRPWAVCGVAIPAGGAGAQGVMRGWACGAGADMRGGGGRGAGAGGSREGLGSPFDAEHPSTVSGCGRGALLMAHKIGRQHLVSRVDTMCSDNECPSRYTL
jgi:hypothetical protein